MELVRKGLKYLKARGLRAFIKAVFVKLGRMLRTRHIAYENVDVLEWLRDNYLERAYAYGVDYEYDGTIYLIVPVYNGYEFFDALFGSIPKTQLDYKVIIIDDCSTDGRVLPYLRDLTASDSRITLVRNEENHGFVKSVNKGLRLADNHAVVLNTDIELPDKWLERLMYPIIFGNKVASSTPYTNSGVITSFPVMGADNPLFEGLDLATIDEAFSRIKPAYTAMPTGVGNCLGMSFEAIQEIGLLDEDAFAKGYGEENDWCQRAIKKGFTNVLVDNLYIYHKHGGSFTSKEKEELIERNSGILASRHPGYNVDVASFFAKDPSRHVRNFVSMYLLCNHVCDKQIIAFDHSVGGGATAYLDKVIDCELKWNNTVITMRFEANLSKYLFEFRGSRHQFVYKMKSLRDLRDILAYLPCKEIITNSLVTFPDIYETLEEIVAVKKKAGAVLRFFFHDYFSVCPTVNLLDRNGQYCNVPDVKACNECFISNNLINRGDRKVFGDIQTWRGNWVRFLVHCDEITVFSNSSRQIAEKALGEGIAAQIKVVPHQVTAIPRLNKTCKTTSTLNIGLIGAMAEHKGAKIVQDMVSLIERQNLNINIILIGYAAGASDAIKRSRHFMQTGEYMPCQLASLTLQHDIDILFIPSIWPETFSYTCQEAIEMGMPVACFDIGAPAERVAAYEKGLVISEINAVAALEEIRQFVSVHPEYFPICHSEHSAICHSEHSSIRHSEHSSDCHSEHSSICHSEYSSIRHSERSEESYISGKKILRFAQDDSVRRFPKVLFVIEQESFASRYRVEHFKEQLMAKGIPGSILLMEKLTGSMIKKAVGDYSVCVIYRCPRTDRLERFIDACHASGKKVFYSTDDFIFDYESIKHLSFLSGEDYVAFDEYSYRIRMCMEMCDGYIVSTNHLEQVVGETFPGKPVCVNRNVASLEMLSASLAARGKRRGIAGQARNDANPVSSNDGSITLIYCSGSKTHNNDFAIIENVLASLFERFENVRLSIIGVLELGEQIQKYQSRINRTGFIPWQELPALLAAVDINLMPLEDDFFHRCKSENKWLEAALVDVPTVGSHNPELEAVIEHGVTGFLCKDMAEWGETLSMLIENRDLREKIGRAAGELVRERYVTIRTGWDAARFVLGKDSSLRSE